MCLKLVGKKWFSRYQKVRKKSKNKRIKFEIYVGCKRCLMAGSAAGAAVGRLIAGVPAAASKQKYD